MFINRPDVTATAEEIAKKAVVKGAAELIIAKHRNGSLGRVQLRFIGESTKFVDVEDQNLSDEEPQHYVAPPEGYEEDMPDAFADDDTGIPE